MAEKVTIILESAAGKDEVEVDADLWKRFEAKAKRLEVDVRSLVVIALDTYVRKEAMHKKPSNNWVTFNFWPRTLNISHEFQLPFFNARGFIVFGKEGDTNRRKSICLSTKGISVW